MLGKYGSLLERATLLKWAKKQKVAINQNMGWEPLLGDFSSSLKVNIVNFTRLEFKSTVESILEMKKRFALTPEQLRENELLEQDIAEMIQLTKQEEEEGSN